jgi:predicted ester cyclase
MSDAPAALLAYINGLKAHDVDAIADTVADDLAFVTTRATLNKTQFLDLLRALYGGFPDWHYDHDAPEVREGEIAVKWRQGGTHTGAFALPGYSPVPATGRTVQIPAQHFFYQVRGGKIVRIQPEEIPGGAPGGIFEQIGAAGPPLSESLS